MPLTAEGYWFPELSPKQLAIYNSYCRYTLASGPKKSGKTWATLHRIVRHAVETPRARIGMFAKTVKNAKSGGIWNDMTEIILPEWLEAGQTRYTTSGSDKVPGPKQDAQTRMMYFKIENAYGGQSEFQLHSIDNENEVEAIAKGTRFSCFYFSELSNFRNRMVFDITSDQLRMPKLDFKDHLWIADTNPADDGEDSWIFSIWWKLMNKREKNKAEEFLCSNLHLVEVMIEDNPYLTPEERADLYARFAHSPDLFKRYIEGKWVRASENAIFHSQFSDELHVLGDATSIDTRDWEVIQPNDHCIRLISGWDLGDKFHSAHIIDSFEGENGKCYAVLDEICQLDKEAQVGLTEFCEWFLARYKFWMNYLFPEADDVKRGMFEWTHWSDNAALSNWRAGAETYDKNLVYKYTDGEVMLMGAPKFPGSIAKRINLCKILLFEQRLVISANCKHTIEMFKSLRAGTGAQLIEKSQIHRHVFDSLSYALSGEEPFLLMQEISEVNREKDSGALISVPL